MINFVNSSKQKQQPNKLRIMKKAILILAALQLSFFSNGQVWTSSNGIEDKLVRSIISYSSDTLLAGVDDAGIYISYDKGVNWSQFALDGETVYSLIKIDNTILAGTYDNEIYKATSLSSEWAHISINNLVIESLKIYNDTIFACTWKEDGGIYFSIDNGELWSKYGSKAITALNIDFNPDGRRYVATATGMYYSDYNSGWIKTTGLNSTIRDVDYIGNDSIIYCCDSDGLYLSTDNGVSAQKIEEFTDPGMGLYIIDNKYYVLAIFDIIYTSDLHAQEWNSTGLNKNAITLLKHEDKLIAGTTSGIFRKKLISNITENHSVCENIKAFPNPTKDLLQIENINSNSFIIEIMNINGQTAIISNSSIIDVSMLSPGLYFYKIIVDNNIKTGKIIKE